MLFSEILLYNFCSIIPQVTVKKINLRIWEFELFELYELFELFELFELLELLELFELFELYCEITMNFLVHSEENR